MTNWHDEHLANQTLGQRAADIVARGMGSWKFVFGQTAFIALWMISSWVVYILAGWTFDPFPWILLNLFFSTQASYASPIILMAQNRSAEFDRAQAQADHETIVLLKSEMEILKDVNGKQLEILQTLSALSAKPKRQTRQDADTTAAPAVQS